MSRQNSGRPGQSGRKQTGPEVGIKDWLMKGLTDCLQFEPPVEVVNHVMIAETEEALVDFLQNLLDMKRAVCQKFVEDVVRIRKLPRETPTKASSSSSPSVASANSPSKDKSTNLPSQKHSQQPAQVISLKDAAQLDRVLLPGRRQCQCLATKHGLVGNCIKCGRIVCLQEGAGPCMFCGNAVGVEASKITSLKDVIGGGQQVGLEAALEHRDKLLEYDKTSAQRTKIYDDQSDFFAASSSAWLNEKERKALIEKQAKIYEARFGARKHKTVALDFAGRQIVDVVQKEPTFDDEEDTPSVSHSRPPGFGGFETEASYMVNPLTAADSEYPIPQYVINPSISSRKNENSKGVDDEDATFRPSRLQDSEILEMSDRGVCLSVQQPYASLIVLGIKTFEGRSWATSHRGRLWIISSSKPCTQELITSVEKFYKRIFNDDSLAFPRSYPSGCLMGCVDLVDCLPQEQYRERFPDGECEDLFVWVLANPKLLSIQFPVTGQKPNLYRLAGHVHRAASRALIST